MSNQLKAMLSVVLATGLLLGAGPAQAKETEQKHAQADTRQAGDDRQDKHEPLPEKEHPDNLPAITLSAPAAGSARLYPAAFNLEAAVAFPGKAGTRNDRREGVEIEFLTNGQKFAEAKRAPYSASYTPPRAGIYTLSARIRYGEGKRTILSNAVTVISDLPPDVSLTNPADNTVLTAPANFTLNAEAAAPIGSIARVEFYNGATLIGTATGAPYTHTWSNVPAGSYTITAKATDNYGFSSSTTAVSVVSNAPPAISLANPADNTVVAAPGSFTLSANAADNDGSIAKVEYYNGTALIGTATAAPYSYTWNNVAAGIYTITARATDNHGASTASTPISIISDTPPSVGITAPAEGAVSTAPGSFTLTADAASSMSTIALVEYYNGATLIGTATGAPYTYTWSNVPAGSYTITAKATDGYGITNTSAAINVVSNAAPTVSLTGPAANAVSVAPGSFTLTAEAADSDGTIAKVEFHATDSSTNTATLIGTATQAPYTTNWSNVPAGSYTLTVKATDNHGAATSSAVGVTVKTGVAQAYYIHTDHLDTPRTITDTSGNIVWQWDNTDPFGNNMVNENPNGAGQFTFNLRFPGQYFDRETNLNYNFYRDGYNPEIGAYTQSDPIGLAGGINTYTYVGGNPLNYTDPTGLFHMYECWGGSNWSGCASGPDIPANPQPPRDALDACYAQHDYCYAAAQSTGESNSCSANQSGSPKPSVSSCDAQLAQCLVKVDYSKIDSLWGRIFGPYSTWWAALHARISR